VRRYLKGLNEGNGGDTAMDLSIAFFAVIDRLISLVKRREEVNRSTFNDMLSPAMASIEEVHKDYLASFARYRLGLKDKGVPLNSAHPVFDSIKEDNIFSEQLRSKVMVLQPHLKDEKFGKFLTAIHMYLFSAALPRLTDSTFPVQQSSDESDYQPPQQVRSGYGRSLSTIFASNRGNDEDRRQRAIKALDDAVMELQKNYRQILVAFTALKKNLLSPK
jgi:hypothetical protein